MTWLASKEYLFHKWPRICSVCRNHYSILSSVMTYHPVYDKDNTTGATCGAGTPYPSGTPEYTHCFSGVHVSRSLVFCVMLCRSLFGLLSVFFWPLYYLPFFDLRLIIRPTPLLSLNFFWSTNYQRRLNIINTYNCD
jgi:hypothetical protein